MTWTTPTPAHQICMADPLFENDDWTYLGTFEGKWDLWGYRLEEEMRQVHVRWMAPDEQDDMDDEEYARAEGFAFDSVGDSKGLLESLFGHAYEGPGIVRALLECLRRVEMKDDPSVSPGCRR